MSVKSSGNDVEQMNLLAEQKRKLWAELREELFVETGEALHTQYEIPQDIGEMSILDLLSDAGLAVADIRRAQLTSLEEALRRLEMGTYGKCEGCGERIDLQRLKLVPFTAYCLECQKQQEGPSRPPGVKI